MSELGSELQRHADALGDAVSRGLSGREVSRETADAAASLRRRRLRCVGAFGVAGVVAVGAGAWVLAPEPPLPALQVADGVVAADVPPIPPDFDGLSCITEGMEAYVPWTEPGVTIASDEVRDLGITVDADVFTIDFSEESFSHSSEEPGGVIEFEEGAADPGGEQVGVIFDVSWEGDALYEVEATAMLVAGGRVVSDLGGWEAGWLEEAVPELFADSSEGAGVTLLSSPHPYSCTFMNYQVEEAQDLPLPAGDVDLHTWVQIKSEDGVPLATFVDANGLDGTTVRFSDGEPAEPLVIASVEPIEIENEMVQRSMLEPVRSFDATFRDALAARGGLLRDVGSGLINTEYFCEVPDVGFFEERVLPLEESSTSHQVRAELPTEVSLSAIESQGVVEFDPSTDGAPPAGSRDAELVFVNADGVAVALAPAYYGSTGSVATWDFADWSGCADVDAIEAGETYSVVAASSNLDLSWLDHDMSEALEGNRSWTLSRVDYLGEVSIVP